MSRNSPAIIVAASTTLAVVVMFSRSLWTPPVDHDVRRAADVPSRVQPATPIDPEVGASPDAVPSRALIPPAPTRPEQRASTTDPVGLWLATVKSATVGSTVDLATTGTVRVPDTAAIEVTYDAAVLHARSTEERDYRDDAVAYGGFHAEEASPGVVRLTPKREALAVIEASGRRAGLVQFEPIAAGESRVEVRVVAPDSPDAAPRFSQPWCDCDVIVLPTR